MNISVVIPARNDIDNLKKCIDSIKASEKKPHQIIVVDDVSGQDIKTELANEDILILRLPEQGGPSCARNTGAKAADGDIILFLDADVFIKPDTLQKIERLFKEGESAVVGVFDDSWHYENFFSDYKNLLMRYTYENVSERAPLFFTSIAAIKRELFSKTGGFDERYKRPSTEDTAFGNVLWKNGIKPLIAPQISVFHNKGYSFFLVLRTDFLRASGLLKMRLRKDIGGFKVASKTSVPAAFVISVFITISSFLLFLITRSFAILAILLMASGFLNIGYLSWLYKKRGFIFCLKSALFIFIDHLAVFFGLIFGFLSYISGRRY